MAKLIKPGIYFQEYDEVGVKDIFQPSEFAEAEAKRLIRGVFVKDLAEYMHYADPPYLIDVGYRVDSMADMLMEAGTIKDYEVESLKADSQGFHIDMIVYPPGKYWQDMYFTILLNDNAKINRSAFDAAMKGV